MKKTLLYIFNLILHKPSHNPDSMASSEPENRAPWKSRSLQVSVLLTLLGGGIYFNDQTNIPLSLRIGTGYFTGFVVGWFLRRFMKLSMLIGASAIMLIGFLKHTGWLDLDWTSLELHVRDSITWLNGKALALKEIITGFLPSAGTASIGIFKGFRWK